MWDRAINVRCGIEIFFAKRVFSCFSKYLKSLLLEFYIVQWVTYLLRYARWWPWYEEVLVVTPILSQPISPFLYFVFVFHLVFVFVFLLCISTTHNCLWRWWVMVYKGSGGEPTCLPSLPAQLVPALAHRWKPPASVTVLPGWWWIFIEYWWMLVIGE